MLPQLFLSRNGEAEPQADGEEGHLSPVYFCFMFSRLEAAQLKKEFWTVFGQYMTPVLSVESEKVSWVNYKTGEKDVFFRMQADNKTAVVAIEITHADLIIQQLFYEHFLSLKNIFEPIVGPGWNWQLHVANEHGKTISRIYKELNTVSIFKKEDWPQLITFFKASMIALDEFWSEAKYSFEMLH